MVKRNNIEDEKAGHLQVIKRGKSTPLFRIIAGTYFRVGFIGLLIATTMWYAMSTSSRVVKHYAPHIAAATEIKLEVALAHLWFEEIISGDSEEDIGEVWSRIDHAEWHAMAMLEGGENEEGKFLPLEDSILRIEVEEVLGQLRAFRSIAEQRLADVNQSAIGSDVDQRFDMVFNNFLNRSDEVLVQVRRVMNRDVRRFQSIQLGLIVLTILLTGTVGLIIHRFQRRQAHNLGALKATNQQLVASEQQLKASNQQLVASEQQLRAANQQLTASEQQLRASNQQLTASEQQLRASSLQLQQSLQRLALHTQQTPMGVIEWNVGFEVTEWNPAAETMFGFSREEALGKHAAGLIVPESAREIVNEVWSNLLANKGGTRSTNDNIRKDGKIITCEWYNTPLVDDEGKVIGVASLIMDITDRLRVEKHSRNLAHIVESSLNEIYIFDAETLKFVQVNRGARENLGYTAEELARMTPLDIKPKITSEEFTQITNSLRSGAKEILTFETVHQRKDGSLYDVEVHLQWSEFDGQPVFVAIIVDITETNRLHELESRAERLETAGTIAGQVAHDFNNLLAPIMAYPELIHEGLPHDHQAHAYVDAIEDAARKIAVINQDLLTMGRRGHYNQNILDLNRIVLQTTQEMESQTKTIACEVQACKELMKIKGGGAQIHRLLTNLLVNARDAMDDIGQITITTENYYADDTSIAFGIVPKGEYVKLTVTDSGCGIPENIIQKILDPFFSTKTTDKKRGSGLGLSVVDAVMRDHKGYLDLQSEVGHGTSFYLYFPTTREEIGTDDSKPGVGGTESLLIVDDDSIQREVSTRLLRKLGYNVTAVESGEKAIEFLRENQQDLMILDMVMPGGLDGADTYRRIIEFRPGQKAIVLSGFSESERIFEAQKLGVGAFVKKPITKDSIATAVRTELDRKPKPS